MKNSIFKVKNYQGLTGNITFDSYGDRYADLMLKTIKDGQYVAFEK